MTDCSDSPDRPKITKQQNKCRTSPQNRRVHEILSLSDSKWRLSNGVGVSTNCQALKLAAEFSRNAANSSRNVKIWVRRPSEKTHPRNWILYEWWMFLQITSSSTNKLFMLGLIISSTCTHSLSILNKTQRSGFSVVRLCREYLLWKKSLSTSCKRPQHGNSSSEEERIFGL